MHHEGTSTAAPALGALKCLVAALALALAGPALAQSSNTATNDVTLPAWQPPPGGPGLGVGGAVRVDRVRFEGLRRLPQAELDAVAAPYLGRSLRALDIEDLRQRLTRALVDKGYVNSGALLAERPYEQGTLVIRIVEGELVQVRQNGLQGLSEAYLASRLVNAGEPLNVNTLQERYQLLLNDPLFTRLNSRLLPGDAPGRAVLDVDVTRARPWTVSLFAHNHLAPAVGSAVGGIDGTVRNLVGWGDALSGTLYGSRGAVSGDLGWTVPLLGRKTLATLRLARTHSSVVEEPLAAIDVDSVTTTAELGISHPVIDRAAQRLSIGLSYSLRNNKAWVGGVPWTFVPGGKTSGDRVADWRLGADWTLRLDRHVVAARLSVLQGRNNVSDELVAEQIPPRNFRLWQLQAQAALALDEADTQLLLRGQFQTTSDRLVPLEQMAVGGRQTVRGYRENTLVRDRAASASAELHYTLWRDDARRAQLRVVPFLDAGTAWNVGEDRRTLASTGLGLSWTYADFEGELFVAHRLKNRPTDTHGDLQDRGIHLQVRYRPF